MTRRDPDDTTAMLPSQKRIDARDLTLFGETAGPGPGPTVEEIEAGLINAGARRALAQALADDALTEMAAWAVLARHRSIGPKRIATLARAARSTIYGIMGAPYADVRRDLHGTGQDQPAARL